MSQHSHAQKSAVFSTPASMMALGGLFALNAVSLDAPLIAIPAIASQFGVSSGQAQLVLVLFLLGFALAHIPIGLLGDRFGRRPVILVGMVLTTVLAFVSIFAPSFEVLLSARFAQGMTSACGGLLCRAMIRDVASGKEDVSRLTSNALSILAVLIVIAPLLSGFLLDTFGWQAVLAIVFCYALTVTSLTFFVIPETFQPEAITLSPIEQFKVSGAAFMASRQSIFAALLGAIVFSTYFIYSTIGASVMVDIYAMKASAFAPIFALSASLQFLAAKLNGRMVQKHGVNFMLSLALICSFTALILVLIMALSGQLPLFGFVLAGILFTVSHGLTLPNSIALTLDPLPAVAGFAASIHGMLQTGLAALVGIFVSAVYAGTTGSVLFLFGFFGLLNVVIFLGFKYSS